MIIMQKIDIELGRRRYCQETTESRCDRSGADNSEYYGGDHSLAAAHASAEQDAYLAA